MYSVFQCSAIDLTLTCPGNQTIFVTDAHYGQYGYMSTQDDLMCKPPSPLQDCIERLVESSPVAWDILKDLCDGETTCTFNAQFGSMTTCGETLIADYTVVFFECQPGLFTI